MRLGLLIRDSEYRDALAERLSSVDNDLFVNILDGSEKDTAYSLILTDIMPYELEPSVLSAIKTRTVFLTGTGNAIPEDCHSVFKYSSISYLISRLTDVYNEWQGSGHRRNHSSKLISVCSESDAFSSVNCRQLARQIIYSRGGRVIIIPLSYINDYGSKDYSESNHLNRLLYSMRTGRCGDPDTYVFTDSYGVSYMNLPAGINPVSYLDSEELSLILSFFGTRFDVVICDAGTCLREENISIMEDSDALLSFERGRRYLGLERLPGAAPERLQRIRMSGGPEEAAAVDEAVRQIYGEKGRS